MNRLVDHVAARRHRSLTRRRSVGLREVLRGPGRPAPAVRAGRRALVVVDGPRDRAPRGARVGAGAGRHGEVVGRRSQPACGIGGLVEGVLGEEDAELLLLVDQFEELFTLYDDPEEGAVASLRALPPRPRSGCGS